LKHKPRQPAAPQLSGPGWKYNAARADRVIRFFSKCLVHVEGELAGKPFIPAWWQEEDLRAIFGRVRPNQYRIISKALVATPKKQGKSTEGAGVGLFLTCADHEPGARVISAAADRKQARLIFDVAAEMVKQSPALSEICRVLRNSITVPDTFSSYSVVSADVRSSHGPNLSGILFDELHTQPNRELWDSLTLGRAARRQPLIFSMTTAGFDRESLCWTEWQYGRDLLAGRAVDPSFYARLFEAPENADWDNPELWAAANPNLGESVQLEFLEDLARRARVSQADLMAFRRFHLNQWTQREAQYLDMVAWDGLAGDGLTLDAMAGRYCYAGLDLANTKDLNALGLVFPIEDLPGPAKYFTTAIVWTPADTAHDRGRRDGAPYQGWADQGHVRLMPGKATQYDIIRQDINALNERVEIREIAVDRWNALQIAGQLTNDGFEILPHGQGFRDYSAPTRELERLVILGLVQHDANPCVRRSMDQTAVELDPAANKKPTRKKQTDRIDPTVGILMGLGRAMANEGDDFYANVDDLLTTG